MSTVPADVESRWSAWLLARNRRGTRTAIWLVLFLYPAFGLLDCLLAPRAALPALLGVRAFVSFVSLAMFGVLRSRSFDPNANWIAPAYIVLGASGISFMTVSVGGLASPYYAGLTLYLVAIGLLFVWPARVVAATHASIIGSFLAANLAMHAVGKTAIALSNLAFLSATALIAGVGQVLLYRTHRDQHEQRLRIEQTTARLERAHAELQQLDEFKSRFFANMTHELRTPLALVLTPLQLVLDGEMGVFTDAQRSAFEAMFKNALKLLKLINDLLDLSRLEESRLRLDLREQELVGYLRTLVAQTQPLAQRKSIALEFACEAESSVIRCDLERLERVFVNLLSNAIKFTPPGGHVQLSLVELAGAVQVRVKDDGQGFPPEKAARIFERFYQVDMAGTRRHGGAGIGLALARELVLLHGGTIEATSGGEGGAQFTVTLPRRAGGGAGEQASGPPEGREWAPEDSGADWVVELTGSRDFRLLEIEEATERRVVERDPDEDSRPHTALVVEDDPRIVRLIHTSLRRHFKILTALDGRKGLEMALRQQPSLVVTDLMMPGMDGLELTRRLREDERARHIPVLMLTARGEIDDRVRGLETGVSAYLTKPFAPRELVTCARQLVKEKEQTAELVLTQRMDSLETVAAGLAHEMNNPLNYAKNALARVRLDAEEVLSLAAEARTRPLEAAEVTKLDLLTKRVTGFLGVAESGLKRIGGTVELMGRYGRAGFRRQLAPHDAWEATRTVVGVVLPATGRDVQIELDLRGDGSLECVPEELNQVLSNLVQNAIEAAPEHGGRVWIRGLDDGEALELRVEDNGPGIAPEVRARLFAPFLTTKGPGRGMGLGLTIARRVVQSLQGSLRLVSEPGRGAEFVVRLPRRQESRERPPSA
jgi:signal transduction histidine kinase